MKTLEQFQQLSGLKANVEKTKFYNIGATNFNEAEMNGFTFAKDNIKMLGITITKNKQISEQENFAPKAKAIETILKQWSRRKLSLKGKITVINALALSLIVYPTTVLEAPTDFLLNINKMIYTFLWDGKKPKIAAKVIESTIKLGGLKMPNIFLKVKSWQLTWLKRALLHPTSTWVQVLNCNIRKGNFRDYILGLLDKSDDSLLSIPTFYRNILNTLYDLKQSFGGNHPLDQILWL
jgi:hypothetical protein